MLPNTSLLCIDFYQGGPTANQLENFTLNTSLQTATAYNTYYLYSCLVTICL